MELWQLKQMQSLPLEVKIEKSKLRIKEWYEHYDGQVYVSFSGGKDSTGLEFPEIKEFVRATDNVEWLKPKMGFRQVIEKYGYPVISKDVANCIEGGRKGQLYRLKRLDGTLKNKDGGKSQYDRSKWKFLLDAPFKISELCCNETKKKPFKKYEKLSGNKAIIGTMAIESQLRTTFYIKNGCNAFEAERPHSTPFGFWKEKDIWDYIKFYNIPYSKIYDMGYDRTGCVFCMFGCHLEKGENRFQRLKRTHPQLWNYCMKPWNEGG